MVVLTLHVILVLSFVNANFAVPSTQAKLAYEGSDGDSQESNLSHTVESILTKISMDIMKKIENTINWGIIKNTDNLESTKPSLSSYFEEMEEIENTKKRDMFNEVKEKTISNLYDNFDFSAAIATNIRAMSTADWKLCGDCILNSCSTLVRPGGGFVFVKQDRKTCISSCIPQKPKKMFSLYKWCIVAWPLFLVGFLYTAFRLDVYMKTLNKAQEQRIIEKLKILSQDQFSDSDDSEDEEQDFKNPEKNLEKVYHVPESSMENFENFEYFEKLKK